MSLFGLFGGADSDSDETEAVDKTEETEENEEKEENTEEESDEEEEHGTCIFSFLKSLTIKCK